jgi:hypothetical protein
MILKGTDSMKIESKIIPFEIIPDQINLWTDLGVGHLEHEEHYSKWLKQQIQDILPIVQQFNKSGFLREISEKNNLDYKFLRKLALGISKFRNIYDALLFSNGYQGQLGLDLAITKIKFFRMEKGRKPVAIDKGMAGVLKAIDRGEWKSFGINSWNNLLEKAFNEVNIGIYKGKKGLEFAIQQLKAFKKEYNRKPVSRDKGMGGIRKAVTRGEWKEFGINTWNEILIHVFGKVNQKSTKRK